MPDKRRCVSGCKGLDADICDKAPRCSYANGERRQFCRLARTHKMNKRDCAVRRKTSKKQKADTIHKFMKNTKSKRRVEFLKAVCDDSGVCIALGTNREKIIDFFDGDDSDWSNAYVFALLFFVYLWILLLFIALITWVVYQIKKLSYNINH